MKLLASLVLLSLACCVGPEEMKEWQIVIVNPNGQETKRLVKSWSQPIPVAMAGGQIKVMDNTRMYKHDWESQIMAPTGWEIRVELPQ